LFSSSCCSYFFFLVYLRRLRAITFLYTMRTQVLAAILSLLAASHTHAFNNRHAGVAHRRQATTLSSSSSSSSSTSSTTSTTQTTSQSPSAGTQPTPSVTTATTTSATTITSAPPPPAAGTGIPPIQNITSGMPSQLTLPVTATFAAGASPPISGAPGLPTPCMLSSHLSIVGLVIFFSI
jgi:hypothetical protein